MATLTVLKFNDLHGAKDMVTTMQRLNKEGLIRLEDAAIVEWDPNKKKPKTRQLHDLKGAGALTGSFWGLLFGLIFFVPILGLAVGAAMGALAGSMAKYGVDEDLINEVRSKVTPGTSALFLLTSEAVMDKVMDELKGKQFEIIRTNLSKEQEAQLREAFADEGQEERAA